MKILLDLDSLEEHNITVEQYYFLALLNFKKLDILIRYTERFGEFSISSIEDLKTKGFLTYVEFKGDITSLIVTDKGKSIIESLKEENVEIKAEVKSAQFNELISLYPKKTPNNRKLQSNVAVGREKLMKSYFKNLVITKCTHEEVIKAVENEIKTRSSNNSANFFPMLSTYINQGLWMGYIGHETKQKLKGHLEAI